MISERDKSSMIFRVDLHKDQKRRPGESDQRLAEWQQCLQLNSFSADCLGSTDPRFHLLQELLQVAATWRSSRLMCSCMHRKGQQMSQ